MSCYGPGAQSHETTVQIEFGSHKTLIPMRSSSKRSRRQLDKVIRSANFCAHARPRFMLMAAEDKVIATKFLALNRSIRLGVPL